MAKITKCDICGKQETGRNPEGFHEVPLYKKSTYNPDQYCDMCEDCYDEYSEKYDIFLREQRKKVQEWIDSKTNKEGEST